MTLAIAVRGPFYFTGTVRMRGVMGRVFRGSRYYVAGRVITQIDSWFLSGCGAMPLYPKLHHSRSQGARIEAQDLRGAEWSFNAPTGVFERANDVVAFYFFKRLRRWEGCGR